MISVKDFIDFNTQSLQCFSLPKTLINQIFDNSSLLVLQKLLKTCKYLKALHLQKGKALINNIHLLPESCSFDYGNGFNFYHYFTQITVEMKKIIVLDALVLENLQENVLECLIPKLDLSKTLKIVLYFDFGIKQDFIEKILQPSITYLKLSLKNYNNSNISLLAFQRCPKMEFMNISTAFALTKNNFKEMILTKRKIKLQHCSLSEIEEIDLEDFIAFIDTHLASSYWMVLKYNNIQKVHSMVFASYHFNDPIVNKVFASNI